MRRMFRWAVPVTDQEHEIKAPWMLNNPTRVEAASAGVVEFWCEIDSNERETTRVFQVAGTGHPLPEGWSVVGTTQRTADGLVWHLLERNRHKADGAA